MLKFFQNLLKERLLFVLDKLYKSQDKIYCTLYSQDKITHHLLSF